MEQPQLSQIFALPFEIRCSEGPLYPYHPLDRQQRPTDPLATPTHDCIMHTRTA